MRFLIAFAFVFFASFALGTRASACGGDEFAGVAERLRAIEARPASSADAAFARDRELAAMLGANDAPLWRATDVPCTGDSRAILLRNLARQRVLALWGEMLALRAVDAPIYPAPYRAACSVWDVRSWQVAFVAAWSARVRPHEAFTSRDVARALDADPRYAHARDLAYERARRLRVTQVPAGGDDGTAWLAANRRALDAAAPQLRAGEHCGPLADLWVLGAMPMTLSRDVVAGAPSR